MKYIFLCVFYFLTVAAYSQETYHLRHLTYQQMERLKTVKEELAGVDTASLWSTVAELEKSRHPEINLEVKEAVARAYLDIAAQENVRPQDKKQWLYSMVCLNMAYLQFGGATGHYGSTTELNRLIRQKLIEYLPTNALKEPGFTYSLN